MDSCEYILGIMPLVDDTNSYRKRTSPAHTARSLRLLTDAECFILTFYDVIRLDPLRVFACLAFVPTTSMLRQS